MGSAELKTTLWFIFLVYSVEIVRAEDSCYGAGAIATSVVLSVIVTLLIIGAVYYWIRRRPRTEHLILETDPEKGKAEYAFDNPGFKDAGLTPISKSTPNFEPEKSGKQKWNHWPGLSALTTKSSEKRKTLDDSAIEGNEVKVVALKSHDFTGLGFNICGNMKEGIFIRDILHRGPASESGKLNPGDRINSVTISFEHIVYEDALTILSYASPYEVIIEAKGGKVQMGSSTKYNNPRHPIYRSSSSTDLQQVDKTARRKLYSETSLGSNYSTLHKSISNVTTLERRESKSPKPNQIHLRNSRNISLNSEQLKNQLEQKITSAETEARLRSEPVKIEIETQKTENKHQKFGIKVFPIDQQKSPKIAELSQNDNNVNIEKNKAYVGIDEVDETKKPQVEKRKKKIEGSPDKAEKPFNRNDSLNGSGLKRDLNGIPQEIPSYLLNAAVAARRNRKSPDENLTNEEETKTPKKTKGKAPLPPPEERISVKNSMLTDLNEIKQADEIQPKLKIITVEATPEKENISPKKSSLKSYNSDSDEETDNQSSVNTIELNSSDITIHHEENEEKQNRKTVSTGDLTKIHKTRKSSTGTLERAQSLDITDTGIPTLTKKRKGGKIEDTFDMKSDEDLFGKAMLNKEPRLSLILDGLNTFQRNRLKKSSEWGNLEDAILRSSQDDTSISPVFDDNISTENLSFNFGEKSAELDALVNKINEIRRESQEIEAIKITPEPIEATDDVKVQDAPKNQIWPTEIGKPFKIEPTPPSKNLKTPIPAPKISPKPKLYIQNEIWPYELLQKENEMGNREIQIKTEAEYPQQKSIEDKIDDTIELKAITHNIQPRVIDDDKQNVQEITQTQTSHIESSMNKDAKLVKETVQITIPQEKTYNANGNSHLNEAIPISIRSVARSTFTEGMIDSETPPEEILDTYERLEVLHTDLDDPIDAKEIPEDLSGDTAAALSDRMKIHKRQQIPNGIDEILPPPSMVESNLEQEIFEELKRSHTGSAGNARMFISEASSSAAPPEEVLHRTQESYADAKRNSETGELCTREINNTDETKTSSLNDGRNLNDTESFIFNERYLCSQEEPYEVLPEDTNISDDIKVSRHSLGSLERPKSDDAKSIESLKYFSNISNVTINSGHAENGSSNLHSLEFSVNDSAEDSNHSILSDNSELYTTALNKTVIQERDTSKITISTPDLIKNVTIAEAINTLNNDMDQTSSTMNYEIEDNSTFSANNSLTNGTDAVKTTNGDSSSSKSHSSLTYITEIQVTPNNGNISEIEIVPSVKVEHKQDSRNVDDEYENYVKNFKVDNSDTSKDVKIKNEELKDDLSSKIDPEKELHKIQEIVQEQLKKLPEMRFSTSSYESPSRIPEKRQSQIELLKSNFEKSPPKSLKTEVATKSRIPISTTMKTPPTSPERRDSRNLDTENQQEILELMSSSVHSTPISNSFKYQKSPNKNVTITSIRNNSKIPSGLPILGGSRPPIPPKKPDQDDMIVHVSTNSNINSFKQWVFDPVDSVTNISLSGQKADHK